MLSQQFYDLELSLSQSSGVSYLNNNIFSLPKKIITEKQMILDILYLLLGMPGSIISKKTNSDQLEISDKYEMTHLTASTLNNAIKQALKMCNETKYVQIQTRRLYNMSNNGIVRSFCEAVFDYMQEVKKYFSQVLAQVNDFEEAVCQKITLLSLSNILLERNHMLSFIIRCLNTCFIQQERKPQFVRLLDKMWEIQQELLPYSQFTLNCLVKIFKRTLRIFFLGIQDWFCMQKIPQNVNFFICMEENKIGELPEGFLHRNTQIQLLKLPKMLENESKGILQIGKTIRFIKLYYEDYEKQKLMEYLNIESEFKLLTNVLNFEEFNTFKRVKIEKISMNERFREKNKQKKNQKSNEPVPQQNPYQMFTFDRNIFNVKWIQKRQKSVIEPSQKDIKREKVHYGFLFYVKTLLIQILQNINKKCLKFFRNSHDTLIPTQKNRIQTSLIHSLIGIKKFMLLEQGDFVEQFLNAAQQIIDQDRAFVSHTKIYSCIDEAIENSNAKHLPKQILNSIHFDFIKYVNKDEKKNEKIRLWVLFCFNFRQQSPMSYIFTTNLIQKLKDICNLIFKLKKGQSSLTKIWDEDRQIYKTDRNRQKLLKKAKILRNSLTVVLNQCLGYLLIKIDVIWNEYKQKIEDAPTVFEIVSQTVQAITKIQKFSTYDNLFFNGSMLCLALVEKFRKFHRDLQDTKKVVTIKQYEQLEFELRSISEIIMKIPQLNEMINYNSYFDKIN